MTATSRDSATLKAVECLYLPYIWGGNDPAEDLGLDCSGFIGYVFREIGLLPHGYDNTAQGYYNKYSDSIQDKCHQGCLVFYGKSLTKVTHVMLALTDKAVIGAVRGNRYMDTPEKAQQRGAEVTVRRVDYRKVLAIVDPFKEVEDV